MVPNHTTRIPATHVGSLPRPADLLAMIIARQEGVPVDEQAFAVASENSVHLTRGWQRIST